MKIFVIILALIGSLPVWAAGSGDQEIPAVPVEFSAQIFTQNSQTYLALSYNNFKFWHTYWKNPGDAGLPFKNSFNFAGKPISLNKLEWPTPKKYIEEGNMLAYGYSNSYSLFYKLTPVQVKKFSKSPLTIDSKWLVCKHVCIPGKAKSIGTIQAGKFKVTTKNDFELSSSTLKTRLKKLPQLAKFPTNLDIVLAKAAKDQTLNLYYNFSLKGGLKAKASKMLKHLNLLTPFPLSPFDFEREKLHQDKNGNLYGKYQIQWDGEFTEPEIPFPADGKFKKPFTIRFLFANPRSKKFEVISKSFASFSLTAGDKMESFFNMVTPINKPPSSTPQLGGRNKETESNPVVPVQDTSISLYILFAFLGGLILNIMPCVLPVISIKLFGLIKHSEDSPKVILRHNLFYSLGVLSCFAVLATAVVLLKSAGETVGWGFQLQSPIFIACMVLILFIFSLNLFGVYEFHTPGGSKLGQVECKDGYMGDFLSGVLATILSTPCSAPFLGTALTFGFTSGGTTIFGIFMAIGLGLSFPFLLTGFFPKLISFLPKPGNWMNHMKKFLGVTLILTIVWLLDVFYSQIGETRWLIELGIVLALILAAFIMRKKITKKFSFNLVAFTLPLVLTIHLLSSPLEGTNIHNQDALLKEKQAKGLDWEKWSESRMHEHQSAGNLVFIDFTAKWCFTCKVNERVVLETDGFQDLVKKHNLKLLLGDWTKRDKIIGSWLEGQGLVGVPAYFIQKKNGELINLGETISLQKIEENI